MWCGMPAHGAAVLRLEASGWHCLLEIQDDGRGGSQAEGNGVRGMRERVEALGGTLRRETSAGTKLTIMLPLAAENRKRPGVNMLPEKNRKPIRVVLAEDQGMVLGALAALLEIEEDIVVAAQARNGKEALDAVAEHKPDVLITDIEMPEMSGLEVAAELKRRA